MAAIDEAKRLLWIRSVPPRRQRTRSKSGAPTRAPARGTCARRGAPRVHRGSAATCAAGNELDRFDPALGSPPHAHVLASSGGHSRYFPIAREDPLTTSADVTGETQPHVRAVLVYSTPTRVERSSPSRPTAGARACRIAATTTTSRASARTCCGNSPHPPVRRPRWCSGASPAEDAPSPPRPARRRREAPAA